MINADPPTTVVAFCIALGLIEVVLHALVLVIVARDLRGRFGRIA